MAGQPTNIIMENKTNTQGGGGRQRERLKRESEYNTPHIESLKHENVYRTLSRHSPTTLIR